MWRQLSTIVVHLSSILIHFRCSKQFGAYCTNMFSTSLAHLLEVIVEVLYFLTDWNDELHFLNCLVLPRLVCISTASSRICTCPNPKARWAMDTSTNWRRPLTKPSTSVSCLPTRRESPTQTYNTFTRQVGKTF